MTTDSFPARLKELRKQAGLTQTELAIAAGVTRDGVARWEAGNREPSWSAIQALAKALGVTCMAFASEQTEQTAEPHPSQPGRPQKSDPPAEEPQTPRTAPKAGKAKRTKKGKK